MKRGSDEFDDLAEQLRRTRLRDNSFQSSQAIVIVRPPAPAPAPEPAPTAAPEGAALGEMRRELEERTHTATQGVSGGMAIGLGGPRGG